MGVSYAPTPSTVTCLDGFCGAGGSTSGLILAGFHMRLALNHWPLALEIHNTNYPFIDHDECDLSLEDPRRYASTIAAWFSPDCVNHSGAKGEQRKDLQQMRMWDHYHLTPDQIRSRCTMWDVYRFALVHDYRVVMVENVVEVMYWDEMASWLEKMHAIGYEHKIIYLNSMFCGTPQSRDRWYCVFWKRGHKAPNLDFQPQAFCEQCSEVVASVQCWKRPDRQWGRYGKRGQYVYRCPRCAREVFPPTNPAASIIDWGLAAQRIGDRRRPLKETTMERIRHGAKQHLHPFTVDVTKSAERLRGVLDAPLATQTCDNGLGLVTPFITQLSYGGGGDRNYSALNPLPTQTTRQDMGVVMPYLVKVDHGSGVACRVTGADQVLPTITAVGSQAALVTPQIVTRNISTVVRPATEPISTITASGNHQWVLYPEAFLMPYYGTARGMASTAAPIGTIETHDRYALVQALTQGEVNVEDLYFRMLQWHELMLGQDFAPDYIMLGSQRDRVRAIGYAVSVKAAQTIGAAVLETFVA